MLKKFRNRTLVLQTSLTSGIFIAALIIVYAVLLSNQAQEIEGMLKTINEQAFLIVQGGISADGEKLQASLKGTDKTDRSEPPSDQTVERSVQVQTSLTGRYFNAELAEDGSVQRIESSFSDESMCREIAEAVKKSGKNNGKISTDGADWQYQISQIGTISSIIEGKDGTDTISSQSNGTTSVVSCLDITESRQKMARLGILFLAVGSGGIAGIFMLSLYFTNHFLKPVQEAWEGQRRFVADASHELKTPISIINANVDVLLSSPKDTILSQKKWIDNICDGTERMRCLIEQMMSLSKTENGNSPIKKDRTDVSQVFLQTIRSMEINSRKKRLEIFENIPSGIIENTDEELVRQVLQALCENAVKYTPEDGKIRLSLCQDSGKTVFTIKNSGEAIPEKDLPHLFERFYRVDRSRGGKSKNFGLGLAIAKACAERLGGSLKAENGKDGLVTFTFLLNTNKKLTQ